MYACWPTPSTSGSTSETPARSCYVTLAENITDTNDKIYAAVPDVSAKLAADASDCRSAA
jgi:hypothetical protein